MWFRKPLVLPRPILRAGNKIECGGHHFPSAWPLHSFQARRNNTIPIFKRRTRTEERATPTTFASLLGLNDSHRASAEGALRTSTAVARAATVVAGAIGAMPIKAYRPTTEGGRQDIRSPLLIEPHRILTAFEWRERIALDLLTHGSAYCAIERNGAGVAAFLDPLPPARVAPKRLSNGDIRFEVFLDDGSQKTFTPEQVLHIPGPSLDGRTGLSPIGVARVTASAGIAADEYALRLWESGALNGGILSTESDLTPDQAKAVKERWAEKVAGLRNSHDVAVLDAGLQYQSVSINPRDAQFLEAREWTTKEIFKLFGLNEHGEPHSAHDFLKWTLLPYVRRIEQRLTRLLPAAQFAEFTVEGLLRADVAVRYPSFAVALQNGWLTVAEVRELENLPALPDTEELEPLAPNTGTPNAQIQPERED